MIIIDGLLRHLGRWFLKLWVMVVIQVRLADGGNSILIETKEVEEHGKAPGVSRTSIYLSTKLVHPGPVGGHG